MNTMQNPGYMARQARVLQKWATIQKRKEHQGLRRMARVVMALGTALVCFFLLKAATLAYFGDARFQSFSPPPATAETAAGLRLWLTGIDPVTRVLAEALSPGLQGRVGG